jgi:hypothetical protein
MKNNIEGNKMNKEKEENFIYLFIKKALNILIYFILIYLSIYLLDFEIFNKLKINILVYIFVIISIILTGFYILFTSLVSLIYDKSKNNNIGNNKYNITLLVLLIIFVNMAFGSILFFYHKLLMTML